MHQAAARAWVCCFCCSSAKVTLCMSKFRLLENVLAVDVRVGAVERIHLEFVMKP